MCAWYLRYKLSLRDLVEMMAERGLQLAHTMILRWVRRYAPEFIKRWNRFGKGSGRFSASLRPLYLFAPEPPLPVVALSAINLSVAMPPTEHVGQMCCQMLYSVNRLIVTVQAGASAAIETKSVGIFDSLCRDLDFCGQNLNGRDLSAVLGGVRNGPPGLINGQ